MPDMRFDVTLFADLVSLGQPRVKVCIDVREAAQSKSVHVIACRNSLNCPEARVLEAACKHYVPVEPFVPGSDLGEGHSNLKGDPGLFGYDENRAKCLHSSDDGVEHETDIRVFVLKMMIEIVSAARMRLVTIREHAITLTTAPERTFHNSELSGR